jgi:hypothetical protein
MRFVYRLLDLGVRGSHLLDLLSHLVHGLYNITINPNIKLNTPIKLPKRLRLIRTPLE